MKKFLPLLLIATLTLSSIACTPAELSTFDGYLNLAGPVLISILDLIGLATGNAPSAATVAKINADEADVKSLAASVATASSQNVQGICGQFNLAVQTFAGDLGTIEALTNVGGTKQAEISDAVSLAQQLLTEVEAPLGQCQAAPTPAAARAGLSKAAKSITKPSAYASRFNGIVGNDAPHVHVHSKAVRVLTFGIAK
jgi:hypothetical protein